MGDTLGWEMLLSFKLTICYSLNKTHLKYAAKVYSFTDSLRLDTFLTALHHNWSALNGFSHAVKRLLTFNGTERRFISIPVVVYI